jgi:hypothetical protein
MSLSSMLWYEQKNYFRMWKGENFQKYIVLDKICERNFGEDNYKWNTAFQGVYLCWM